MRLIAAAVLLLLASAQSAPPAADLPVEQTKKNIKVLQGLPSSQLIPVMAFMSNSLGVTCAHCHTKAWESDEKPAKEAARRMIAMQRDINARNFEGKTVVTCNTCHQGHVRPNGVPDVASAGWNHTAAPAAAPPLPAAEAILARLAKPASVPSTRVIRGTVERYNGRDEPKSAPFTLTVTREKTSYDTELSHPPEAGRALAVYALSMPPLTAKRALAADRVEMSNGETWTIDDKGTLLKRRRELTTPVGILPEEIDYSDFRNGLPYVARWSRADYRVTYTVTAVEEK